MFRDLGFFITEALIGMRRSGMMIVLTIITFTLSLMVLGSFMLLSANLNHMGNFFASRLEVRVYLHDHLTNQEIQHFQDRIQDMSAVEEVIFVDKKEAWSSFRSHFKNIELSDLLEDNPLPHAFKVKLQDPKQIGAIAAYLETFTDHVEDVGYLEVLSKRLTMIAKFTKWVGLGFVLLLTFATLLIIVNTIRLTIIARENEVGIMTLVGATSGFIKAPFMIEGLLIGIIGASTATVILHYSYGLLVLRLQDLMPYLPILGQGILVYGIYISMMCIGLGLGVFGAHLSISKTLKSV